MPNVNDKEPNSSNVEKVNNQAGLTVDTLLSMFMEQLKESSQSNKALADAVLQSRVPYVDPQVIADRKQRAEDRKQLVAMEMRNRANAKKFCAHLNEGGKPNIKWMQHSNGIILGVCGTCRSEFDARKPEDARFLAQDLKSQRNMGRAGEHARRGSSIAV